MQDERWVTGRKYLDMQAYYEASTAQNKSTQTGVWSDNNRETNLSTYMDLTERNWNGVNHKRENGFTLIQFLYQPKC